MENWLKMAPDDGSFVFVRWNRWIIVKFILGWAGVFVAGGSNEIV